MLIKIILLLSVIAAPAPLPRRSSDTVVQHGIYSLVWTNGQTYPMVLHPNGCYESWSNSDDKRKNNPIWVGMWQSSSNCLIICERVGDGFTKWIITFHNGEAFLKRQVTPDDIHTKYDGKKIRIIPIR